MSTPGETPKKGHSVLPKPQEPSKQRPKQESTPKPKESMLEKDWDKPSLLPFFLVEFFKWGVIILGIYIFLSFLIGVFSQTFTHAGEFLSWLFFGTEPASQ